MGVLKRLAKKVPVLRSLGRSYRNARWRSQATGVFKDPSQLVRDLRGKASGTAIMETVDGLKIEYRRNIFDAYILKEVFLDKEYLRRIDFKPGGVIVDIGGYMGDFSVYAAYYLDARVYAYEPSVENFDLFKRNIELNGLGDRITVYNKAVSDRESISLTFDHGSDGELHVSSHGSERGEQRIIPAVTPRQLVEQNGIEQIELLKIDCEGGEYEIFPLLDPGILAMVRNLVFEHHPVVPDWRDRLAAIFAQLRAAGFTLIEDGMVVSASRR